MAKRIILVENEVLQKLCGGCGYSDKYETVGSIYGGIGGALDQQVEIVPSHRLVPREHFRRDFTSALKDMTETIENLQTIARHLGYMKSEI